MQCSMRSPEAVDSLPAVGFGIAWKKLLDGAQVLERGVGSYQESAVLLHQPESVV